MMKWYIFARKWEIVAIPIEKITFESISSSKQKMEIFFVVEFFILIIIIAPAFITFHYRSNFQPQVCKHPVYTYTYILLDSDWPSQRYSHWHPANNCKRA